MNKTCTQCKEVKPISDFGKHKRDGFRSECKDCKREWDKKYNKTSERKIYNARIQKQNRQDPLKRLKLKARMATNWAIKTGKLKRLPCECGNPKTEAHHKDYSKPMDVLWLCKPCHWKHHKAEEA